ncbi:hypothetical protein PRZ48_003670 [Zasmidium cellare]|uniref:AB hydrolase-1 domain-containing protein n=1 Tax=Zasmidium cellare TaxID=395010 RepID=A0ABR0EWR9_ZASCE|nr:hypothetical protein PRZ48_003670 [Zasmidium cellare]
MKKTLLLVFIHGFKGSDHTFHKFPQELAKNLSQALPKINVLSVQYPQYETRGDLKDCVAKFKEWLQNKTIDLEVANRTPSPTVDPSVHIILVGHSMGGIVAAETLLSIARDEPVPSSYANDTTNSTTGYSNRANDTSASRPTNLETPDKEERSSSAPPRESSRLFFPYIKAVLAFDTPYLGISPGVLAHGAEDRYNQGTAAYKAWDTASQIFGWNSPKGSGASTPIANASSKGLPAANGSSSSSNWGKYALYGGAAAAIAGVAGAAYLNWNQINQGLTWAGSHLEFVGCLARGAELQKRVEKIVDLQRTHGTGFANFYGALGEKVTGKTKYAGILGDDRTFCVVPTATRKAESPTGTKRDRPAEEPQPDAKKRKTDAGLDDEAAQAQQVHDFAEDTSKSKGHWVKCVNQDATDELKAHTSMFAPDRNPDYKDMLPRARDQIIEWIDSDWYETSAVPQEKSEQEESATAGGESEELPS